jgi:hypothetical protein
LWATQFPWVKMIHMIGELDHFQHIICLAIWCPNIEVVPIIYNLTKHQKKRTTFKDMPQIKMKKGESYVHKQCQHLKNVPIFASTQKSTIFLIMLDVSRKHA